MSMRVLVAAHNHPALHPGARRFSHTTCSAPTSAQAAKALFLEHEPNPPPGAARHELSKASGAGGRVAVVVRTFDRFFMSQIDLYASSRYCGAAARLQAGRRPYPPLLLLGAEFPHIVRRTLPQCRIVMNDARLLSHLSP